MGPVSYLHRGVVETADARYLVGDVVCSLYTINKGSSARSSAHLAVAIFFQIGSCFECEEGNEGQCPIFSASPFAPVVQFAHSIRKQMSSSFVFSL